jgi:hypothetical protein
MAITLLLDVGPLNHIGAFVGILFAFVLYAPLFYLSRSRVSPTAQLGALLLAFLLFFLNIWAFKSIILLGPVGVLLLVRLLVLYVPILIVVYKLMRNSKPLAK